MFDFVFKHGSSDLSLLQTKLKFYKILPNDVPKVKYYSFSVASTKSDQILILALVYTSISSLGNQFLCPRYLSCR